MDSIIALFYDSIVFTIDYFLIGASAIAPWVFLIGGIALFIYVGVFGSYKLGMWVSKKYLK